MKKTAIIGLATLMAAGITYGQGTVNFANPGALVSNILTMAAVPAGDTFWAALYWLPDRPEPPTTADFDAAGPAAIARTTNFMAAGIIVGGTTRIEGITPPGGHAWFQVRAWESLYGGKRITSYADALVEPLNPTVGRMILAGTSNIFRVDTADPTLPIPETPAGLVPHLRSFYVVPVPEPSLLGLGVLGIGALLLLRRRS